MNVWDTFNHYCQECFDEYDFGSMFDSIRSTGNYCSEELRNLLMFAIYTENAKRSKENIGILTHYFDLLSDPDEQPKITLSHLLFIVAFCSKIRDNKKSPTAQSNLYM